MPQDIRKANPCERFMDGWAVYQLIAWAAGKKATEQTKARFKDELCELAAELGGPNPTPVERVLAETAATAWFALRHAEGNYAAAGADGPMSIAQSDHIQRRLDRAHRRLLSTLKTLATVRRLAVPALQINLAHQQQIAQLNTGGSS